MDNSKSDIIKKTLSKILENIGDLKKTFYDSDDAIIFMELNQQYRFTRPCKVSLINKNHFFIWPFSLKADDTLEAYRIKSSRFVDIDEIDDFLNRLTKENNLVDLHEFYNSTYPEEFDAPEKEDIELLTLSDPDSNYDFSEDLSDSEKNSVKYKALHENYFNIENYLNYSLQPDLISWKINKEFNNKDRYEYYHYVDSYTQRGKKIHRAKDFFYYKKAVLADHFIFDNIVKYIDFKVKEIGNPYIGRIQFMDKIIDEHQLRMIAKEYVKLTTHP